MRKLSSTNAENQRILKKCGLTYAMYLLDGRWKIDVIWAVHNGICRYSEIKRKIEVISEKMLTQRLGELVEAGLIIRNDFGTIPPRVEYELSPSCKKLIPILEQMRDWGNEVRENADFTGAEKVD